MILKGGIVMDLVKIGRYIAEKRKSLGLTQRQLAEKLGKSDKSVSKWERGICLPDVSVYLELCEILGISLNEFLAGEDIETANVEKKSEDTLIQITKDSSCKQRYLKRIIVALLIAVGVFAITFGIIVGNKLRQPQNYIEAVDPESVEMKTAELLSGIDGTMIFRYHSKDTFKTYLFTYQNISLENEFLIKKFWNFPMKMQNLSKMDRLSLHRILIILLQSLLRQMNIQNI